MALLEELLVQFGITILGDSTESLILYKDEKDVFWF